MRTLIDRIFKREPALNYVIAEYKPVSNFVARPLPELAEYAVEKAENGDEMHIDNIYQKN